MSDMELQARRTVVSIRQRGNDAFSDFCQLRTLPAFLASSPFSDVFFGRSWDLSGEYFFALAAVRPTRSLAKVDPQRGR